MSLPSVGIAGVCTAILVGVAAIASPSRGAIRSIGKARAGFPIPQARALVGLQYFAILLGTAAALGFFPANVFVVVGSLGACVVVRNLVSGTRSFIAAWWLLPVGWSLLAGAIRFHTVDLGSVLGAHAALGPGLLVRPIQTSVVAGAAALLGLVSGAIWLGSLPRPDLARPADSVIGWSESMLVSAAALSPVGGLLVGSVAHGPLNAAAMMRAGGAFVAVALATAVVSATQRGVTGSRRLLLILSSASLAAVVAAVILR